MEHRVLLGGLQRVFGRHQLADRDAVQGPVVRSRHRAQLLLGLRERHVEHRLAEAGAFDEELHRERRLAGPGNSLDQVEAALRKPSTEDIVEPGDSRRGIGDRVLFLVVH
jgi:hypothetical protein